MSNAKIRARRRRRMYGSAGACSTVHAVTRRTFWCDIETATLQQGATGHIAGWVVGHTHSEGLRNLAKIPNFGLHEWSYATTLRVQLRVRPPVARLPFTNP